MSKEMRKYINSFRKFNLLNETLKSDKLDIVIKKLDNFFIGNGSLLTGISGGGGSYGNADVAANLAAFGSNPISTTGNVTAGNFVGGGAGTPTISSATNLDLSAVSAVRVIGGGTFRLPSLTTAQIANTIAANGDMIYNSSVNKFQGYENGAWANII